MIQSYTCELIMNHISRTCKVTDEQGAKRQTSLIKVCDYRQVPISRTYFATELEMLK